MGKLHGLGQEPLQGLHRRRRTRVQVHMPQSQIPMQALRGPSVPVEQRRRRRGDSRRLRRSVGGRPSRTRPASRRQSDDRRALPHAGAEGQNGGRRRGEGEAPRQAHVRRTGGIGPVARRPVAPGPGQRRRSASAPADGPRRPDGRRPSPGRGRPPAENRRRDRFPERGREHREDCGGIRRAPSAHPRLAAPRQPPRGSGGHRPQPSGLDRARRRRARNPGGRRHLGGGRQPRRRRGQAHFAAHVAPRPVQRPLGPPPRLRHGFGARVQPRPSGNRGRGHRPLLSRTRPAPRRPPRRRLARRAAD